MAAESQRDLVLPPQSFAWVLDKGKGYINTLVGPTKTPMSEQERPVRFNSATRKYEEISLDQAVQPFYFAPEGYYLVLENPAEEGQRPEQPAPGNSNSTPQLNFGRKVHLPGPCNRALWPGQVCEVIEGHSLASNQYVLCRVYNAEAAKLNWSKQVSAPQTTGGEPSAQPAASRGQSLKIDLNTLVTGKLFIVKGTEVSFFIPPTGVEVVRETGGARRYVRDANTLESLEYSILVDESGEKRYERGPAVVFPQPTETFLTRTNSRGEQTRRFQALNLSKLQGIYVQVIKDYNDDDSPVDPEARKRAGLPPQEKPDHKAGEELFITGKQQAIYFPRAEHAIIKYGDDEKHNAVAVPKGEGRYVLNRMTGEIKLVKGPHMLLADPVTEVIVRRILSEKQVSLWFPGNAEAMLYNRALAQVAEDADVAAQNFVSDNAVRSRVLRETPAVSAKSSPPPGAPQQANAPAAAAASVPEAATATFGSHVRRGSQYTPPRMVTLDTKYDGAVSIGPYVGYAVQVVSKTGERQVVVGPANHLLEYDETLDVISLSTGTPKNHDNVIQTVYLQTQNNRVTDDYEVETRDMVRVNLRIACRLHFEGDPTNWFKVDNYIRLLCQHIKSRLSSAAKQHEIGDFYNNAIAIVRDTILGKQNEADNKRPGLGFAENGMRVYDVEVLAVSINDGQINLLLQQSQVDAFKATLQLGNLQRMLNTTRQSEGMKQQIAAEEAATVRKKIELQVEQMMADFKATIQRRQNEIDEAARLVEIEQVKQKAADVAHQATLAREKLAVDQSLTVEKQRQDLTLAMISAESQALSQRIAGIQGPLGDVLLALSSNETMQKLAQASAPLSILGGSTIVDVIGKALEQTGLAAAYQLAKGGVVDGKSKGVGSLVRESTRRKQD